MITEMKLNTMALNKPKLNTVSLNSIGERARRKEDNTPYIAGHVIDNSTTFTFKVNGADVTVPVGADGWWKYNCDESVTYNLASSFYQKQKCDYLTFANIKCNSINNMCNGQEQLKKVLFNDVEFINACYGYCFTVMNQQLDVEFRGKSCDWSSITNMEYFSTNYQLTINPTKIVGYNDKLISIANAFSDIQCEMDLVDFEIPNCTNTSAMFRGVGVPRESVKSLGIPCINANTNTLNMLARRIALQNLTCSYIRSSFSIEDSPLLTLQSVLNLINATDANGLTFTLHADVLAKCENEWAESIEEALDNLYETKGYDVFLTTT